MATYKDILLLVDKVSGPLKKIQENTRKATEKTNKFQEKIKQLGNNLTATGQKLNAVGSKMQSVGGKITGTVTKITAAATALTAAFVVGLSKTSDYADKIDKQSQKIGMSAQKYQELNFVLSQNGMNVDNLQMGYKTLTNKMVAAQKGSKDATNLFRKLNVTVKTSNGELRNSDEVFDDVIKKLLSMKNPTERMATAIQLFGRNAQELAPLLNNGLESYEKLKKTAQEKGMILSNEEIANAVKYKDTMDKFSKMFETRMASLAIKYMPQVTEYLDKIMANTELWDKVIQGLAKIISAIVKIVDWFANLSKGGKIAIGVFAGFIAILGPTISLAGSLTVALGGIATALGTTMGVVAGSIGVFLGWTAVIAGIVAGIWAMVKAVQTLAGWIQHLNRMKISDINTNFNQGELEKLSKLQASMGKKAFVEQYGKDTAKAVNNYNKTSNVTNNNNSNNTTTYNTTNNYNSMFPFSQAQYAN